jgi:hypothetical protein
MSLRIDIRISPEKRLFSVCFTHQGFVSFETLPKREQFNSAFSILIILLYIVGSVRVLGPKMRTQGCCLQIDNAKSHNAALSHQKPEDAAFTRLPGHPIPLIWHPATSVCSGA